ncbi:MAG: hypothetical protein LBL94_03205 [Prevotellaceae bacterium]|jgi:hypothetical protein|nr:hypothetical protein [Prevotellaceae bacterium]
MTLNSPIGQNSIWVFVEGDDDCKIYPKFFDESKCLDLSQSLRNTYRVEDFRKTALYAQLYGWQSMHGYSILY